MIGIRRDVSGLDMSLVSTIKLGYGWTFKDWTRGEDKYSSSWHWELSKSCVDFLEVQEEELSLADDLGAMKMTSVSDNFC